ncbi:hypothetical protein FS837_010926 [Tulasnella sp. UAMH 9824]|nr:hypothetical protein FS837_010926 [Tulasnella sp. UAMH 9824]
MNYHPPGPNGMPPNQLPPRGGPGAQQPPQDELSLRRARLAQHTLGILQARPPLYQATDGRSYDLSVICQYLLDGTTFHSKNEEELASWRNPTQPRSLFPQAAALTVAERSTMAATRYYAAQYNDPDRIRVACLNFASPRRPGGSFREGTAAQEESLARSSTLILSLESATARPYYEEDTRDGLHSHSMVYSPGVAFIKDDDGNPHPPYMANIVTSAAVNAGEVMYRRGASREVQKEIEKEMEERMARILQLCELRRDRVLVLGCFGTGMSPPSASDNTVH